MSRGAQAVSLFDLGATSGLPDGVRAFRLVLAAAQQLRTRMDARLRADDLTTQQAAVLTAVSALQDPSISDVAAAIGSTRQNVTQLVNALVRKEMLRVDADPADSRRRVLSTTRLSDDYWEHRNADDFGAVAGWFGMLDAEELRGLCDALQRVVGQSVSR
ncbi:MAG TPA: MarR family winged helix-turn-helix transcriptional regulator [Lapillicoccus sp.]|nr:MarR family winged helix-turn-helix transcriptional regulator [Lapillicoccus sp.]